MGALVGVVGLYALLVVMRPLLVEAYGINIAVTPLDVQQWALLLLVLLLGVLVSLVPGWIAYRRSLQDGLSIRV
jgi:putative ABC transport system permease protein